MKLNKLFVGALLLLASLIVLEGCAGSKGCGCGTDLNRAYKTPKRYH